MAKGQTRIIRGDKLPPALQRQVLAMYVHRWTHENAHQTYRGQCPGCEQAKPFPYRTGEDLATPKLWTREEWHAYHKPLTTDAEWLKDHAFHVTKKGTLSAKQRHAEPACMAEGETRELAQREPQNPNDASSRQDWLRSGRR